MSSRELQIGAEEEFHVVDLETRRSTPEVDALLGQLDGAEFAPELQRSLVETNTPVCDTLDELRAHLQRLRARLAEAAEPHGLGVVAAGTVPLVDVDGGDISAGARFAHMQHEYQVLVNEQHICGAQIHVDVPDRDEAVQVVRRVAPHLPTLLAISASSPYWNGRDTGYASYRELIWSRWPTAGPPPMMATGAEYDAMIQDLIDVGDDQRSRDGLLRRPAQRPRADRRAARLRRLPRGRFRRADRRPVPRARAAGPAGVSRRASRSRTIRHELLRAATWRAARSGLEGDLVNPAGSALIVARPARRAAGRLAAPAPGGARRLRAGARAVPDGARPRQRGGPAASPVRAARRADRRRRRPARRAPRAATFPSTSRPPSSAAPDAARGLPGDRLRRGGQRGGQRPAASTAGCSARSPGWASTA